MSDISFYAQPGTRVSFQAGPDSRTCEYVFGDSGRLSFREDDQEPVSIIRSDFANSDAHAVSETPPQRQKREFE